MGDRYNRRQSLTLASRKAMFSRILASTRHCIGSVIEFGAGTGENIKALRALLVGTQLTGVEINAEAHQQLKDVADLAFHGSIHEFPSVGQWDISMTRGLLIHIPPVELLRAYEILYKAAAHYILIAEYYAPTERMIPYRGQDDRLWARDFAGEMMDRYPDLQLVDYGFVYHRDPLHPQDDVTWFLMEKT